MQLLSLFMHFKNYREINLSHQTSLISHNDNVMNFMIKKNYNPADHHIKHENILFKGFSYPRRAVDRMSENKTF